VERSRRRIVYAGAVVLGLALGTGGIAAAVASGDDNQGEAAFTAAHRHDAAVTQAAAEAAAQRTRPGRLFDAHLEDEGHGLRWEVKSDDGRRVWEVQVDATTGAIASVQPDE
jgi:uncharacterized membrane protein YkoI